MSPVDMPSEFHIGTRHASDREAQYVYRWQPTHSIFMCEQTTADGLEDEILAFVIENSATGQWYVAVEGSLATGVFVGRRAAFRTQEEFWVEDSHEWQVNRNSGGGPPDWYTQLGDTSGGPAPSQLRAETQVSLATVRRPMTVGWHTLDRSQ